MTTLTEQLSVRLSVEHKEYLRGQVEVLKKGIPPVQVHEADVVRLLIERAIQESYLAMVEKAAKGGYLCS